VILYGRNPVMEALRGRRANSVRDVWATAATAAHEPWLAGVATRIASAAEIEQRCASNAHQGVCASAGPFPYASAEQLLGGEHSVLVALDQIQDAECAGTAGVVIPERRAAEVTPAVCKASAGAVEHLALARVRNLADFVIEAREHDWWCYGASAHAGADGRAPVPYDAPDYADARIVLVLGSEGSGLRPRVAKACDELISLPLLGQVDSLGVSAAAAALLYEILQDRRAKLDKAS
jgi:23S rRNA (guanosine2251-2'-O)-methyltransferase